MAATPKFKKKTTLFSLPIELRNTIWHYALEDDTKQCTRKRRPRPCRYCIDRCGPYHEPAVLQVSRQVRSETQSVWYANATFYFHDGIDKLLEFLVFLGNHKTSKIANLKDEPSFGKPAAAREFLEEMYQRVRALGISLSEEAIEVTCHEGLRLLRTSEAKETKIAMRKKGGVTAATATNVVGPRTRAAAGGGSCDGGGYFSDSTLSNNDAGSDFSMSQLLRADSIIADFSLAFDYSEESEDFF
ncbi:hypothetical protein PRZ48_014170 [Zasmidium cellare]|uniref:2EXR domain-containing protein n=1 Tax=Zasmidium cellare TaxID=395010 RepID=A0ABR0E079_ZASCE|nr:hypothetical protein PRZ48_014170 [Zasmidium cellare]